MERQLVLKRAQIERLCREYGVSRLEVFGSAATGVAHGAHSDYDFIARFVPQAELSVARRFVGFSEALEQLLGRKVDMMSDHPIDNPYLRAAVNASRAVVYAEPSAEAAV